MTAAATRTIPPRPRSGNQPIFQGRATQYESRYTPISVILAVPLALLGPVAVLIGLHIDNNLYTQIGLILPIAFSAKNAILIVEMARGSRVRDGKPVLDAARSRFTPLFCALEVASNGNVPPADLISGPHRNDLVTILM